MESIFESVLSVTFRIFQSDRNFPLTFPKLPPPAHSQKARGKFALNSKRMVNPRRFGTHATATRNALHSHDAPATRRSKLKPEGVRGTRGEF